MKLFIIFTSNSRKETILIVSDKWRELLCPFGRKEPDVRMSNDRKFERFEYAAEIIYTGRLQLKRTSKEYEYN